MQANGTSSNWQKSQQPSSSGTRLIAACIALSVLQILFVAAKFLTRYFQNIRFGADDYVMLIALIGSLAKSIMYIVLAEKAGLGYHLDDLEYPQAVHDIVLIKKGFIVFEILDIPVTITAAKISLLLFYVRIFCTRGFRIAAYAIGSLVLALGITVFFETIFQCAPHGLAYGWANGTGPVYAECLNQTIFYRAVSPINVLTGVMISALPIPLIWKLQAPKSQKLALSGVFLLSGLGIVVSVLRTVCYFTMSKSELNDIPWFSVKLGFITVIESGIIIIACCLVSIWPLACRMVPQCLLKKFSCCKRRHSDHQQWYMQTIREEPKSEENLVPCEESCEENTCRREVSWSSRPSSLAELEDERAWIHDDEEDRRHHPWVSYEVHITAGDTKV